jgi:hypothetical protein
MKQLFVPLLAIPLAGCLEGQQQQTVMCEYEAQRTFPDNEYAPTN